VCHINGKKDSVPHFHFPTGFSLCRFEVKTTRFDEGIVVQVLNAKSISFIL